MKAGTPFRAARLMFAAIAAIQSTYARDLTAQNMALQNLSPYEGRGKGKGVWTHARGNGSRVIKRAATKHRNVARNRSAHRA